MRKTIYVSSQEVWDEVKLSAKKAGKSVSQYLLHYDVSSPSGYESRLDCIEGKLDRLLLSPCNDDVLASKSDHADPVIDPVKDELVETGRWPEEFKNLKPGDIIEVDSLEDGEIIAKGQAKLDAERKKRNIKMDKIDNARVSLGKMPFNPQPKGK